MAANQNNEGIIYKCPLCFFTFNDVVVDKYEDGKYHCMKCGFVGTEKELMEGYAAFRSRYKLLGTRITVEDLRKM